MNSMMRTGLILLPTLLLAACSGGSDDTDDAPADAPGDTTESAPDGEGDDTTDPDTESGDAPDGGIDNPSGAELQVFSGGPVGDDLANVCDLLDAQAVADITGGESTAELNAADDTTATCVFGAGEIELTVFRPDLALDLTALEFLLQTATFNSQNGIEIDQSPLFDLPRVSWSESGTSTQALVVNPFYVELRDSAGRDAEIAVLIGSVAETMR